MSKETRIPVPDIPDPRLSWNLSLDRRITKAVSSYHEADKSHHANLEKFNRSLIRLVALCEEKADMVPLDVAGFDPEIRWVPVARAAFLAAGVEHPEVTVHATAKLFSDSPTDVAIQRDLYQEMRKHLDDEHWSYRP